MHSFNHTRTLYSMKRLLQLEWLKLKHYRPFWILMGLYAIITIIVSSSGMFLMEFFKSQGADIQGFNPTLLPLYDYPDIWQNLTYVASFFKIFPAFLVIVSVANEFNYRILRQNIIDGLSKKEWLLSKLLFIGTIALGSTLLLLLIGLMTGHIYGHPDSRGAVFQSIEFLGAYFLDVFTYLVFALLLILIIRRGAIVIVGLFMYTFMIEPFITFFLATYPTLPDIYRIFPPFFPVKAIHNLIHIPFLRYGFMEIQDYISLKEIAIVLLWLGIFIWLIFWILRRKDL